MTDKGTLKALGKNIDGLINYVEVLVTGKSKASATGGPLGNKFFLQTGAKCLDTETEEQVSKFADAGAIKKSVDPEDDAEDEELTKSAPASVWNNVYLPQSVISALGYES